MIRTTKLLAAILALSFCAVLTAVPALAESEATNIISEAQFNAWGDYNYAAISDDDVNSYVQFGYGETVNIKTETPVAGIYLKFYVKSAAWTVTVDGEEIECGQNGFIHEFVDLASQDAASTELSISFPRGAGVCEIALYTAGELPADVQTWEAPLDGGADLVMFSSHADDEQLFFAGILPDAVAKGAAAQVVYFCSHSETPQRVHEQLNGLWTVGVKYYPVLGAFPDLFSESGEAGKQAFAAQGYTEEDFLEWQVENIRRFKPQVLVIHDEDGEYGHGTHIINSATARDAVELAADNSAYPFSLTAYGTWDTPKVYMHLYKDNEIILDFDKPLDYFGGKTAYEMSCLGFGEHKSQHWTWFYNWMYGDEGNPIEKASEITEYSPCRWGLWRSTVGADTKPDMFENIVLYKRGGDDTELSTDTETPQASGTAAQTTAPADNAQTDSFRDSKVTKIIVGCAAVVVLGMIIALIASGISSHREAKEAKRKTELAAKRSVENAQRIREAREVRSRQIGQSSSSNEGTGRTEQNSTSEGTSRTGQDSPNKGTSRDAKIQAAREARARGESTHDKPTDKKY